jgi:GNAT superfamily N-acetyltransferase
MQARRSAGSWLREPDSPSGRQEVIVTALQVRAGRKDEAWLLSDLALRSKGHWGYDQAFLNACRAELTLTPQDVEVQRVTVAERDGHLVGFYALAGEPPEGTLENLFVEPEHIGIGVGRTLWEHAIDTARALGFERITLEADPGAEPFSLAMGAQFPSLSGSPAGKPRPAAPRPASACSACVSAAWTVAGWPGRTRCSVRPSRSRCPGSWPTPECGTALPGQARKRRSTPSCSRSPTAFWS